MERNIFMIFIFILLTFNSFAQKTEIYGSSGGEIIFSFAIIDQNGNEKGNIMRFSPVFNFQNLLNIDVNPYSGFFTGLNIHNVGAIYDVPNSTTRKKFRNYTVGIPVAVKLGKLNKAFVFAGYEIEFPLNYKEKTFVNEKKTEKFDVWFSKRVPTFYQTVFGGFQLNEGTSIKFKYFITNFFNKDYTETIDGVRVKPYENFDLNVFYISLSFDVFRKNKFVSIKTDDNRVY